MQANGLTVLLIKYISDMKFEDIPTRIIDQTKHCILDYLGTALGGLSTDMGRLVKEYSRSFREFDEATVLATGAKTSALDAAFANGVVGHVLELDDGNRFAMGHPGVVTIPAALATAEKIRASGKRLILATVCGYEIFGRLGRAINPSHFSRGFHTTGTLGTMAAAAAAAKVLNLNEEKMLSAFGIAGSLAAGISEFLSDGSMTKQIHAGKAAQNGVLASQLALGGFTGPQTVLEGKHGFFKAFSDSCNMNKVTENLGTEYHITDTYFKKHASGRHTHAAIDATLEIFQREKFDPQNIDEISVRTYSAAYDYTNRYTVKTPLSAKVSMPYCVAVTILRGRAGPQEFSNQSIENKEIHRLMNKIKMYVDEDLDRLVPEKRGAIVTISARGRQFSRRVDLPKGEPENPFSKTELEEKFRTLVSIVLAPRQIEGVLRTISELEYVSDIGNLIELLHVRSMV